MVWHTAGANDLAAGRLCHACPGRAAGGSGVAACTDTASAKVTDCTATVLGNLWSSFPNAMVGQYNYERRGVSTPNAMVGQYNYEEGCFALRTLPERGTAVLPTATSSKVNEMY